MRYKIGDKVTVKREMPDPSVYLRSYMIDVMLDDFGGKQVTIAEIYGDAGYYIEEDGKWYVYGDDDFEDEQKETQAEAEDLYEKLISMLNGKPFIFRHGGTKETLWSDGDMIFSSSEKVINIVADLLDCVGYESVTGYYDPEEDKKQGIVDRYTGFYYLDV